MEINWHQNVKHMLLTSPGERGVCSEMARPGTPGVLRWAAMCIQASKSCPFFKPSWARAMAAAALRLMKYSALRSSIRCLRLRQVEVIRKVKQTTARRCNNREFDFKWGSVKIRSLNLIWSFIDFAFFKVIMTQFNKNNKLKHLKKQTVMQESGRTLLIVRIVSIHLNFGRIVSSIGY